MENKDLKHRAIEVNRLAELLEIEQLANKFGFACCIEEYAEFREDILPKLIQDELNKYEYVAHVLEEYLNAENITDVSDEEKEDMLYVEEEDSCGCGYCKHEAVYLEDVNLDTLELEDYDHDYDDEDDEEEVEAIYVVLHLDEDYADDYDEDSWADEFDDFYSESFENSIFKEMEDFVNGKYPTSMEQEQEQKNMPDNVIIGPELYQILEDYFKKMFE